MATVRLTRRALYVGQKGRWYVSWGHLKALRVGPWLLMLLMGDRCPTTDRFWRGGYRHGDDVGAGIVVCGFYFGFMLHNHDRLEEDLRGYDD